MNLAIALGDRNAGRTWPNPSVGAVLADAAGRVLATGITRPGGRPHAERVALDMAGGAARGGTLYVSLEPCSHHGRTPPCAEAVIASGVGRVVTGLVDPDPRVGGRGLAMLREAGLDVAEGVCRAEAARSHRGHVSRVARGRPWLTLKLAQTPDGFAGRRGERLLVSGDAANSRTHMLRAHADAVMVGVSTVVADDPRLDVRLPGLADRNPVAIVVDTRLRTPSGSRLLRDAAARPTWLLCGEDVSEAREAELGESGAEVMRVPNGPDGRLDLQAALRLLGERGLTRLLCEGGPVLAGALVEADLIDDLVLVTGARALGPVEDGVPALSPRLKASIGSALALIRTEAAGPDRIEHFERI